MAKIVTTVKITRFDNRHRPVDSREQHSRSWLRHFFDIWYPILGYNVNSLAGITDYAGVARNLGQPIDSPANLIVIASPGGGGNLVPAGEDAGRRRYDYNQYSTGQIIGIVVGSNNTAVTPTDNALNTRILHGEGAGTLLYGGCELYGLTFANPNGSFKIRRYFTNKSGGNVTIREVGIYSPAFISTQEVRSFCICRDVVSPDVVVADTEILEVEYTVAITV
ncbi:MAG: hypothetical protein PHI12_07365 [Dehalococcoidales bacterium]|nr:hypothetical protein [Dehalococcoidales bacterium]